VRPRRREVVLGGETVAMDLVYLLARPVGERVLLMIDRWYRSGDEQASMPGSLWRTEELPVSVGGGMPARDSLLAPLQLGRRMLPSPLTPLRIVGNLLTTGRRAFALRGALSGSTPERSMPAHGMQEQEAEPAPDPVGVQT
jgi:hypothetical protein